MNKVLLIGRLVSDLEIQETSTGVKFARFRIAVKRPYNTNVRNAVKGPNNTNDADFIHVVAWRSQAEFIDKYLKKGSMISVEGRLTTSTYNNNEGKKVTRYAVTADRVQGLESKALMQARELSRTQELEIEENQAVRSEVTFEEEAQTATSSINDDVPWDIDL